MTPSATGAAPTTPSPGLEIWFTNLDDVAEPVATLAERLGLPVEAPRPGSTAMTANDPHRVTSYLALRLLIARRLGIDAARQQFVRETTGRPVLANRALHFSLSHSDGHALIALSSVAPVGVDLELPRSLRMSGPRRTAIEDAGIAIARGKPLSGATADARTLMAWVRLEAAAKATGEGIGAILARLDARPGRVIPIPEGPDWPVAFDVALPAPCHGALAIFANDPPASVDLIVSTLDPETLRSLGV